MCTVPGRSTRSLASMHGSPSLPIPAAAHLNKLVGLFMALIALAAPYAFRALAIPERGIEWFTAYVPSIAAVFLGVAANATHAATLFVLATSRKYTGWAAWVAALVSVAYVGYVHFSQFNLRSGSTAGVGVIFIPVYAAGIAVVTWWLVGSVAKWRHAG
jgi:hypothetical protein